MSLDYQNRLEQLQQYLKEQNFSIALIASPANVFYFTGFDSDPHERFMALVWDGQTAEFKLFVPALDKEIAENDSFVEKIIPISDEADPFSILKNNVGTDIKSIGLEMKETSMFKHRNLNAAFPEVSYDDIQPFINKLRLKKSRQEVTYLQEAVDIIEKVLEEGMKKVKTGMTEVDLTAELEYLMKKFGAEGPSFSPIVLSGEKSALPHGVPDDRKFQNGDFLLIDFGVKTKHGYCSDTTRTFVIGEPSEKQKEMYHIVLEANQAGINAVQSGKPLKTFDLAARDVIDKSGYGDYFNNRVGHGLGIDVHEEPSIHANNEQLAEEGVFFTIEPGIYIPGYGGVRIEDEVFINEKGEAEVLTSFPRDLQVL
ncbi:Xaa-Pro peptidase family protein [Virgibacillus siamensis]|uniref:Xaa-Pro peptidase family protein n=1 Tax=Virgibacillus siamensis TaxID=480071 RepID=A0ABN1FJ27_9BACI